MKRNALIIFIIAMIFSHEASGQKKWTLMDCISYAVSNNIQLQRQKLLTENDRVNLTRSKLDMLPDLSFESAGRLGFGRSVNPVTNLITFKQNLSNAYSINSSVDLFTGLTTLNTIKANKFLLSAGLESEKIAAKRNIKDPVSVAGYGNACDAFHQTASSPEGDGAFISMKKALTKAGLAPEAIGYINAHGTGTKNNDLSEGRAIERLFGSRVPPCSSTKSYTGHTLGAAGGIEAVFSFMSLKHQRIWPNLNFRQKMNELGFAPVTEMIKNTEVRHVLSNSFGFGGNNTSLVFSKI